MAMRSSGGSAGAGDLLRPRVVFGIGTGCTAAFRSSLSFIVLLLSLLFVFLAPAKGFAATLPGTNILNTATAVYTSGASTTPLLATSNTVTVTTVDLRTPSTLELFQYAPASPAAVPVVVTPTAFSTTTSTAGPFVSLPTPTAADGTAINIAPGGTALPLVSVTQYHLGEPVFIRVTDLDQNTDPLIAQTIVITLRIAATGELEILRLTETAPDSGVFTGFIQTGPAPVAATNGTLNVQAQDSVTVAYTDAFDGTDASSSAVLVDPYGIVFDSTTGQPVNGATVTIVNAATGAPAAVFGDDGISVFPSAVVTGGTTTDAVGRVYSFPPGGYRFPYVTPGQYRLTVSPPAAYRAPSVVPDAVLQVLPGGPFALVTPGSRGEAFFVDPGPALHIDIPIDPVISGLYVRKTALKQTAGIGDFVPYQVIVENANTMAPVPAVSLRDRLPLGFRYRKGSAKLDGSAASDPAISPDGRTLTFALGDMAAATQHVIVYVAEVGAGSRQGKALNTAVAVGSPNVVSNTATATVTVIEELFHSTTTIAGRVSVDGCDDPERSEREGLAGARIVLEDGTYVVTDRNGMYHFRGVTPGTHVVQLDLDGIPQKYEVLLCEENTRFADNGFSQFVDLQGGALWRADFHLALRPKEVGEVSIELRTPVNKGEAEATEEAIRARKDIIKYSIPIHVSSVPARNLRITVLLPEGATYRDGSSVLDGKTVADPHITAGAVTFRIAKAPAHWDGLLQFDALVPVSGALGPLLSQAVLTADTPQGKGERTPVVNTELVRVEKDYEVTVPDVVLHPEFQCGSAALSQADKEYLDDLIGRLRNANITRIRVTGHTDALPISERLCKLYQDNYVLSQARASSVGNYLAQALHLEPGQIAFEGKGPDEPVASNSTENGRARNRRVELRVTTMRTVVLTDIQTRIISSGAKALATVGLHPGETWAPDSTLENERASKTPAAFDAQWLKTAPAGFAWLWPRNNNHPSIPSTKVAVKHDPRTSVTLFKDGVPVDPLYFDGTLKRQDDAVAVSTWNGIHLVEGDNRFEIVETDEGGAELRRETRTVHFSGTPVAAVLDKERSRLIADGKTPPIIAVRLLDKDGHPAREGILSEYTVDPPHLPNRLVEDLQRSPLTASASERQLFTVGEDGVALIELAPTTRSGEAVVRIPLAVGSQDIRAWLKSQDRDWILVGLAEGTAGYNVAHGNMETMGGSDVEDRYYQDGRVAFYAKGRLKGEWLLTLAYDSAGGEARDQRGLYQTIDPDKYYTIYGDATDQRADAPSAKRLYVKLERDQFYVLFGDHDTGLTVTELSRYSRNMTGFKSEYKSDRADLTVFASDTNQAFVKDEIRGDGTSGLYRLSRRNILINSETVVIETRDRFRSELVLSTQRLTRHLDYTIDYEAGTLFFKSPVFSRDGSANPLFIVATYESNDDADQAWTYGGRGAVRFLDNRLEAGATHVHEGRTGGEAELTGIDAVAQLTEHTKVRAEVAETRTEQLGASTEGNAYLAELTHRSPKMEGSLYVREQDGTFGLGQQNGSETGTRKMGFDLAYRFTDAMSVKTIAFRQETLLTGAVRDMAEIQSRYAGQRYEYFAGLRHAEDTFGTGEVRASEQVFAGFRYRVTDRLTVRAQHDETFADRGGNSSDYPTRTTMGADYQLGMTAVLYADQELTSGTDKDTSTSRIGLRATPWTGAQVGSTMEQQATESGTRLFSTLGLKQGWQVNRQWSLDAGFDRSATIRGTGEFLPNPNVPPASGGEDFTAATLGAGYRQVNWSWTGRVETRTSPSEDKVGIFTGAHGEPGDGVGLAASYRGYRSETAAGVIRTDGDLRLGYAYRPRETRWIVLDRMDLLTSSTRGSYIDYRNWRVVNNLVTNYKVRGTGQVSLQYGAKFVEETIEENDYRGYTDLVGIEGRYDITKKADIGLRVSKLTSWSIDQGQYGAALSAGFTAAKNFWLSVGYNITGFYDRDFSQADFTAKGPFIKLRMKFDQVTAREAIKWFTGQ